MEGRRKEDGGKAVQKELALWHDRRTKCWQHHLFLERFVFRWLLVTKLAFLSLQYENTLTVQKFDRKDVSLFISI